jgi:hypothetical protein
MSRGIENKNPLNIRKNDERFKGEVRPSTDPSFKQFLEPGYGYRAGFVILHTYINKHGLDTIPQIISRWAPGHENPTQSYINFVASKSGISTNQKIDYANPTQMTKLVGAMSQFENGQAPVEAEIFEGWTMYKQDRQIKEAVAVGTGGLLIVGAIAWLLLKSNSRKLISI